MLLLKDYLAKPVEEEIAMFALELSPTVKFSR